MTPFYISVCFGFVAFVFLLTRIYQGRVASFALLFSLLVLVMSLWLWVVYKRQHSPHLITHRVGSNVISQYWVTNPAYLETVGSSYVPCSNGLQLVINYRTNYYWPVWSFWK